MMRILRNLLSFLLEAKALAVVVLGVTILSLNCLFKVIVSLREVLLELIDVRSIEEVLGIGVI